MSKHLSILRRAGLVVTEKQGQTVECRIEESFREQLSKEQARLDLGCCSFRFDSPP